MMTNLKETPNFNVDDIRQQFPVLNQTVNGKPLVYFDNAATTQKPQVVLDAEMYFYRHDNANVHRGVHSLSERATEAYENARKNIQKFINAKSSKEIIFVRGTTEAINLVAHNFGRINFQKDDEIILSTMEHHSNIVPWQLIGEQTGAVIRTIPMNEQGDLLLDEYKKLFNERTKFVGLVHVSNALGTINPIQEMIQIAHQHNVPVLIDGAQAVPHLPVDVQALDCDFYAFSGHKIYGPTGIGILYGKQALLEKMPPYQGGGDMIKAVTFTKTVYNDLPYKFEAGTPNIAGVIGLNAAIKMLENLGMEKIAAYESELLDYATERLKLIPGLKIYGQAKHRASVISFTIDNIHPHDIGTILNHEGVAIRAGHHCAMPVMEFYHIPATVRVSFSFYNTKQEIDRLVLALQKVYEVMHA